MNYSHAFHAGNFADVMKHIILTRLIEYLKKKDAAFRVIDTHAGIGRYDLTGEIAKRSPEWMDGIGKLLAKARCRRRRPPLVAPYLDVIEGENPGEKLAHLSRLAAAGRAACCGRRTGCRRWNCTPNMPSGWASCSRATCRCGSSSSMAGWRSTPTCRPRKSAAWCWSIRPSRNWASSSG